MAQRNQKSTTRCAAPRTRRAALVASRLPITSRRPARSALTLLSALSLLPLLASCVLPSPFGRPTATALPTVAPPPTAASSPAVPASPPATVATSTPLPSATPAPPDLALAPADIALYPAPDHYSGDLVTFDIRPENVAALDPQAVVVRVYHGAVDPANVVAEGRADSFSFDGVPRARMVWAWNTAGLVGEQTLVAWVDPDDQIQAGDENPENNVVTFTVDLRPAQDLPPVEAAARWVSTTTSCCVLHYLGDESAGRDIPMISVLTEDAVQAVEARLGVTLTKPMRLYFLARVIGQGGYAYDAVALSYLDRQYVGSDLAVVVRHEATHVLDQALVDFYPPAMLREGLATYMGGGHFKPEPIPQRAAGLLPLNLYIPLQTLADDFYRQQHEAGYLEGAGFIAYLVDTYGWDRFRAFYASFPDSSKSGAQQLDAMLSSHYGQGLAAMEESFQAWLRALPPDPEQVHDLKDTVALYDTARRYQQVEDPGAYWMSGFLPDPSEGEHRKVVADFIRHPDGPDNIALETMLIAAREALRAGEFEQGEALIAAVNRVLDTGGWTQAPEVDYLAIVQVLAAAGYEAQGIELHGDTARASAIAVWPVLEQLVLQRVASGWRLAK